LQQLFFFYPSAGTLVTCSTSRLVGLLFLFSFNFCLFTISAIITAKALSILWPSMALVYKKIMPFLLANYSPCSSNLAKIYISKICIASNRFCFPPSNIPVLHCHSFLILSAIFINFQKMRPSWCHRRVELPKLLYNKHLPLIGISIGLQYPRSELWWVCLRCRWLWWQTLHR